jgi:hypothetical protein
MAKPERPEIVSVVEFALRAGAVNVSPATRQLCEYIRQLEDYADKQASAIDYLHNAITTHLQAAPDDATRILATSEFYLRTPDKHQH